MMSRFLMGMALGAALFGQACAAETPDTTPANVTPAAMTTGFSAPDAAWRTVDPENLLLVDTKYGQIAVELFPEIAPKHVAQVKALARDGFYDNVPFHRVIDGFMAQGGCPDGTGMGGADANIPAEFSSEPHARGVCSMARSQNPNSASSQFFVCLDDAGFLDNQYTVWGVVESGMDLIDALPKGEPPRMPGKIVTMTVA